MPTDDDAQDPANELRVIVVVLSLEREPWETLEAAQRETWAQEREGVEIFYLQGVARGPLRMALLAVRKLAERLQLLSPFDRVVGRAFAQLPVGMHGNTIRTSTVEYWIGTSAKTHACLKYLARRDSFDYLVRTNSSTYVHLPRLLNHLAGAPRKGYYAGADQGEPHAQGTLIILSSDVVERLANDRHWEYDTVDDAALGRAALRGGVPTPAPASSGFTRSWRGVA